jgi:hypothetical protein
MTSGYIIATMTLGTTAAFVIRFKLEQSNFTAFVIRFKLEQSNFTFPLSHSYQQRNLFISQPMLWH